MAMNICEIDIGNYKCSHTSLLLPIVNEYTWSIPGRGCAYFIGLLYCFVGLFVINDNFMGSIDTISKGTRKIKVADVNSDGGYHEETIKIWDNTIANWVLGSTTVEVILAVVDVLRNSFVSSELGPSVIVGSAAFNVCVIIGICVMAIPSPELRRIQAVKVFVVTSVFSVLGFVWLAVVLVVISPSEVELWEAVLTFVLFWVLVIVAYLTGKVNVKSKANSYSDGKEKNDGGYSRADPEGNVLVRKFIRGLRHVYGTSGVSEADATRLLGARKTEGARHGLLWHRINAARGLSGKPRLEPRLPPALKQVYDDVKHRERELEVSLADNKCNISDHVISRDVAMVTLSASSAVVHEGVRHVRVRIERTGCTEHSVRVRLETVDGTALAGRDYIALRTTVVFRADVTHQSIGVSVIENNIWTPDRVFYVRLVPDMASPEKLRAILGECTHQEITIIDDDQERKKPGRLEMHVPSLVVHECVGVARVAVRRVEGSDGQVQVGWSTVAITATAGLDYRDKEGVLVFQNGETLKHIEVTVLDDVDKERDESFLVELRAILGFELGARQKTVINIINDDDFRGLAARLSRRADADLAGLRVARLTWRGQIRNALTVNGGDICSATGWDYFWHLLAFGWKVLFSLLPPATAWGGWPAFLISLAFISLLSALIVDFATTFGCLVNLHDGVTAVTFVALGTNLPDLFASRYSALTSLYADDAINNVTGSNSVKAFLGVGLSWLIAAIYWNTKGETLRVNSPSLVFSVILYVIVSTSVLGLLVLRRVRATCGAELGGVQSSKYITGISFIALWLVYVLLMALAAYGQIPEIIAV